LSQQVTAGALCTPVRSCRSLVRLQLRCTCLCAVVVLTQKLRCKCLGVAPLASHVCISCVHRTHVVPKLIVNLHHVTHIPLS
jgi:hypothetical protein